LAASLIITTRNRREELRIALGSACEQTVPLEVIVMDDGSTDGTADMVRAEFPQAVLHRRDESRGLILRRNEGARLAKGEVIFSIDDDAAFSTPHVVEQTLSDFCDSRIGAVAIPYLEPHKNNRLMQKAPDREGVWITDGFIGTAHALRRDIFLNLGGYREHLVHQGEESDFCIRMLDAGLVVRLGNSDPILHFESPRRDFRRMDYYGCRNPVIYAWQNVPMPWLPIHLVATSINCLRWTFRPSRFLVRLRGVLAGWVAMLSSPRSPVKSSVYRASRQFRKLGTLSLSDTKKLLLH
jgi:glycosyltransferase involved in cell wall biosynthesis